MLRLESKINYTRNDFFSFPKKSELLKKIETLYLLQDTAKKCYKVINNCIETVICINVIMLLNMIVPTQFCA